MSKRILALLLCAVLLLCAGCSAKAKEFSGDGLTITLTEDFEAATRKPYNATFTSEDVAVFTLREEFELFEGGDVDVDLAFYTDLLIRDNGLDVPVHNLDGLTYFVFEKEVEGVSYTYYAFTYEAEDAFWLVQICCVSENAQKLEDTIFRYAKSVKV